MKIDCKGWVIEWISDAEFTVRFHVDTDEERNALLDAMQYRNKVDVQIEVNQ